MARRRNSLSREERREALIKKAIDGIRDGTYIDCQAAANAIGNPSLRLTIWRRMTGRTKRRRKAHQSQQLLTDIQEEVLINYAKFLSLSGFPLSKRTIAPKVQALCGKRPGRFWVYRFLDRHPECTLGRPTGLDPKRAKCFNFTNVDLHFKRLQAVIIEHGIPWENIHNLDEIGIQLGGGRKSTGELFIFQMTDKTRYKIKSENLELVTILESICGDGTAPVNPCVVFSGTKMCEEWLEHEDVL